MEHLVKNRFVISGLALLGFGAIVASDAVSIPQAHASGPLALADAAECMLPDASVSAAQAQNPHPEYFVSCAGFLE